MPLSYPTFKIKVFRLKSIVNHTALYIFVERLNPMDENRAKIEGFQTIEKFPL